MPSEKVNNDKASVTHQEVLSPTQTIDDYPLKPDAEGNNVVDYSGAHEKTDPKEIALVKKLDWYIMPM